MKVIDDALQGSQWGGGRENTSNVPDCIRFAIWNIMSGKPVEVLETLHRRKLMCAVCKKQDEQDQVLE